MIVFDKIKLCVKEIKMTQELLPFVGCSFYQRALARMIILRIPDFIKYSRQYNNQVVLTNKGEIKRHLNGLSDLYDEFLKKQRDKFSGHIQDDIDFGTRIDLWLNIEFDKIDFFVNAVLEAYSYFHTASDYEVLSTSILKAPLLNEFEQKSMELNIEDKPRISTDLLGISRTGTGGLILINNIQAKFGALNSLELIVDYEIKILQCAALEKELKRLFVKMLLVDIVNYMDNFITRTVATGAKQQMDGLDTLFDINKCNTAKQIIDKWKVSYNYTPILNNYREIRNKVGAHVDEVLEVSDMEMLVDNLDLEEVNNFWINITDLKRKICYSQHEFKVFAIKSEKMHGIEKVMNTIATPFKKNDCLPYIQLKRYTLPELWEMWVNGQDKDEVRSQIFSLIMKDELINLNEVEVEERESVCVKKVAERKIHQFLYQKFISTTSENEKRAVFELLRSLSTSDPNSLMLLLLKIYEKMTDKYKVEWLFTVGEIRPGRIVKIIDILKENSKSSNFAVLYYAVLALYKIDVISNGLQYLNNGRKEELLSNSINIYLHNYIKSLTNKYQIAFVIILLSEANFNCSLITFSEYLKKKYGFLETTYLEVIKDFAENEKKENLSNVELDNLVNSFKNKHYILIAIFLSQVLAQTNPQTSRFFLEIGDDFIIINGSHEQSVYWKAFIKKELGQIDNSINILKHLVKLSPESVDAKIALLEIYAEGKDIAAYNKLCDDILKNYNLSKEQEKEIKKIQDLL